MCFSERVSWLMLALSWSGSAALGATGDTHARVLAAFLAVAGAMQGIEALLWRMPGCSSENVAVSSAGSVLNHAQPLVLWGLSAAFLPARSSSAASLAKWTALAYAAVVGVMTVEFLLRPPERKCTRADSGSLVWQWNTYPGVDRYAYALFLAALVASLFAYFPDANFLVSVTLVSYLLSHGLYSGTNLVGSMWCFFGAMLPWLFVFLR